MAGYQRLYRTTAGDILVTDGDGSVAFYDSTAAGYLRPAGAPGIRLEIKPGNPAASRYVRTYLDGTSLEFNDKGFLTRAVDRFGNATVFGYHAAPLDTLLATITDPMGKVLQLCYNAGCTAAAAKLQKVKVLPGAGERVVSYAYAGDTLVQIQDPDSFTQMLGYGSNGLLASITDRAGSVTRLFYDGMRKLDSIRAPSVALFDGTSGQPKVTYTPAERTAWRPDVSGSTSNAPKPGAPADTALKSTIADPAGAITRYSQDRFGAPTKVTDPFNNSTLLTRDSDGRVTRIDESNGHYVTFSYNAQGQLTYSGDGPGGTSTTLHYVDTLRADVSYVEGDLVRTDYHYYGAGDPGGPAGALKDVYVGVTAAWPATGGGQLVSTYKADPLGRDTAAIDPLGHTTRFFYDPTWGHSLRVRDPSGIESRVTYDAAGRPDSSFSPLTLFTKTFYGPMNQVLSQWVGATGYHYGYTYDPATLQLTRVETPRRLGGAGPIVHKFSYNALGSLIARHDAADTTKADTLKYDLAGNLRKVRTRRGDVIDMSYDKAGRLLSRAGPGMPTDYFAFDTVAGRWNVAWNSVARDSVHLDSRGRLDFWRQTLNGRTYSGTITYDAKDRPIRRVVKPSSPAADSSVVEFVYATTTGVRDSLCVFANPRRCVTFKSRSDFTVDTLVFNRGTANAWRLLQAQDASHRITSQTFTGGTNLAALELPILTYDSLSRNRTRTSPKGGSYTRRLFNYDLFGRLTQACDSLQGGQCLNVVDGTTAAAWSYDSAGNRDQIGITETYGDGNRLTAFGTTNISYDAIGGVVCRIVGSCPAGTGVGYKYSWDALGRLRGIRNGSTGALVDSMFYDALGRRVRKQIAAADEYYVYEGDQVIFDLNAAGTVLREYAWYPGAVDRLLALRATTPVADTLAAILDPINGTVRGLARFRTGAKVKEFAEAPWGDAVADTGLVVRYHFAGREYDSESGLYYMRARYYDPALGRWISEDPIGIAGGLNVYAYAGNDPVNLTDPSGLDPDCKPIDVPPGPGQIPGIGQQCKRPWNPFGPGGPLEWLDPSNECGMDVFHDPECSGYPDQDVLDYYSGLGGAEGDGGQSASGDPSCYERNKFSALFGDGMVGKTVEFIETGSALVTFADVGASIFKAGRAGTQGSSGVPASAFNWAARQGADRLRLRYGRRIAAAAQGYLVGIGDILSPTAWVIAVGTGVYNTSISIECRVGWIQ
ncbi:MAG: RHS repeat-associated core domain-containing protein [Gemmatimonadetes bacterium]|nr:RHS repeat-associated core domain-containing protein [Gemmatimonadota bacterium]